MSQKQILFDTLDNIDVSAKKNFKILPITGLVFAAIGGIILFMSSGPDGQTAGYVFIGLGAFLGIGLSILLFFLNKSNAKTIEHIRSLMSTNPQSLCWGYVTEHRRNGQHTGNTIELNFRDGTRFSFSESVSLLPAKEYLAAIKTEMNPAIVLGYSADLEKQYMDGKL
jgi:hypothetical protein